MSRAQPRGAPDALAQERFRAPSAARVDVSWGRCDYAKLYTLKEQIKQ